MNKKRPGLLVATTDGEPAFLTASIALQIIPRRRVSDVPGVGFGMVLIDGKVASVISCGPPDTDLVLCEIGGQPVALSGLKVLDAGLFDATAGGVFSRDGEAVDDLDLGTILDRAGAASLALS